MYLLHQLKIYFVPRKICFVPRVHAFSGFSFLLTIAIYLKRSILKKVSTVHVQIYWAQWTEIVIWTDCAFLNHGQALQK